MRAEPALVEYTLGASPFVGEAELPRVEPEAVHDPLIQICCHPSRVSLSSRAEYLAPATAGNL